MYQAEKVIGHVRYPLSDRRAGWWGMLFLAAVFSGCGDSTPPVVNNRETDVPSAGLTAEEAFARKQYALVEELIRPKLIAGDLDGESAFLLAQAQAQQGKLSDAVESIALVPQDGTQRAMAALGQSADWLIQLERYDDAEKRLRQILQSVDAALAHRRLAQLLNNQGKRFEAMPSMRALARLGVATEAELFGMATFTNPFVHRPEDANAPKMEPTDLCWARVNLYQGEVEEAFATAEKLRKELPDSASVAAFWGKLIVETHDARRFREWLGSVPEDIETQPEYWAVMGSYYQTEEQHALAVRCFLEAVSRDDTDRYSFLGLARSLEVLGKPTTAASALKRFQLLERVDFIATEISRSEQQLAQMPRLLRQLKRHHEADGWARVAEKTFGKQALSGSYVDTESVDTESVDATLWRTCGIDLGDWPLPDLSEFRDADDVQESIQVAAESKIVLTNVAQRSGLAMQYLPGPPGTDVDRLNMHQTVGGGIGILDFDLDGWPDTYFVQSAGTPHANDGSQGNQLFRNHQGTQLVAVSAGVDDRGYGQGVAIGDINQDGFPDVLVANIGVNRLFVNNGDGTFSASVLGSEGQTRWTTSLATGDLDGDHLPEVYEVNYIDDDSVWTGECFHPGGRGFCNPQRYRAAADRVLRLRKDGRLDEAPLLSAVDPGYGFGIVLGNLDEIPGNDVLVANDTTPNQFWTLPPNEQLSGEFKLVDSAHLRGCAVGAFGTAESCMGVAVGDFDRNQRIDFHITNYTDEYSDLFLQSHSGIFSNQVVRYGLGDATRPLIGWGTQAVDLNANGWSDLVILNGHLYSQLTDGVEYRSKPQLFQRQPDRFVELPVDEDGDAFWNTPAVGRTLAKLDWNKDGRIDLLAYNIDTPVSLLENRSDSGHWCVVEVVGTSSERDAVGAKVTVVCGDDTWAGWVTGSDGFLSKNQAALHFGIGEHTQIDSIEIQWPSGEQTKTQTIAADHSYLAIEGQGVAQR